MGYQRSFKATDLRPTYFMDIDGVVNKHHYDKARDVQSSTLLPECVFHFNRAVRAHDAAVVLSSAWRYMLDPEAMTLRGIEYVLRSHGVAVCGRLVGVTPRDEDYPTRGQQVAAWLGEYGARPYVVIDDGGRMADGTWCDMGLSSHPVVWTHGELGMGEREGDRAVVMMERQVRQWEEAYGPLPLYGEQALQVAK